MKFSEKWLREFINPDINSEMLIHQLTMAGLEVDGIEPVCSNFEGLVIAEVKTVSKHPNADKLQICEVNCGDENLLTIVCGAANVREGMRTVLARVGATLPGIGELKIISLKGASFLIKSSIFSERSKTIIMTVKSPKAKAKAPRNLFIM